MKNKKIPTSIGRKVNELSTECQSLFYRLWLQADEAGVLPIVNDQNLIPIQEAGLIEATQDKIILRSYLSSNYSDILKEDYNPHKRPLSIIKSHGFAYSSETSEIEIPEDMSVSLQLSLNELSTNERPTSIAESKDSGLDVKISLIDKFGSIKFALVLAGLLTLGQSFHTGYSLYLLSDLPAPYNICFAVFTALLLDALIVFFVVRGSIGNSIVFLVFSTAMNLFALHHSDSINWFHYNSYFAILISIIIPYGIHSVANMVHKDLAT